MVGVPSEEVLALVNVDGKRGLLCLDTLVRRVTYQLKKKIDLPGADVTRPVQCSSRVCDRDGQLCK